ncbi:hypothetical protein BG004_007655 [Podila humilis]|nr:hypothetical protein BG004_007655 [Podila humilis]
MITGRELSLFNTHHDDGHGHGNDNDNTTNDTTPNQPKTEDDEEADVFYFIQRILKRTQLSCTTLILALIYIDRFKARLAHSLNKRRTRLDQGADYNSHASTTTTTTTADDQQFSFTFMRERKRNKPSPDPDLSPSTSSSSSLSPTSSHSSCDSSANTSPNSTTDTTTPDQRSHHHHHHHNNNKNNKPSLESWSCIALFLVSVICADKYLFDATFTNAEWAEFTRGQYTTQELNDLERRFLGQLQYKLYVSEPEFDGFLSYLEVILALKQVWGRGFLAALSYSDVRILTQQLMPAYAGRLQFRTLQEDMALVIWQVVVGISRVYLTIVGTIMFAAAGYAAMLELSALGTQMALEAMMCSPGQLNSCQYGSFMPLLANPPHPGKMMAHAHAQPPPRSCMDPTNMRARTGAIYEMPPSTGGGHGKNGYSHQPSAPDDGNLSAMEWMLSQSSIVQVC